VIGRGKETSHRKGNNKRGKREEFSRRRRILLFAQKRLKFKKRESRRTTARRQKKGGGGNAGWGLEVKGNEVIGRPHVEFCEMKRRKKPSCKRVNMIAKRGERLRGERGRGLITGPECLLASTLDHTWVLG